ncbi:MAG: 50S ribosomal protein L9 [Gammaproteobacteria bacterium]|nr:50S ribosomal protein L9 [Gammaproteobacteria bacterium]
MEVILLEKVHRLGGLGEKVRVKPGHGRNYLIPTGKAVPATPENVAKFEAMRAELEKAEALALERAKARAEAFGSLVVTIARTVGSEGKLFGSVGTSDIAAAVTELGIELGKHEVRLPTGPLRQVGEYQLDIHLHPDVDVKVLLNIIADEG